MTNDDDPADFAAAVNVVSIGAARSRWRPTPPAGRAKPVNNRKVYTVTVDTENPNINLDAVMRQTATRISDTTGEQADGQKVTVTITGAATGLRVARAEYDPNEAPEPAWLGG